jgi:two-component system, chemotaxis family, sensor kinase CheA
MATFLDELEEHARALERHALALERDPGPGRAELLKTLFRAAHSLKGAAYAAGVAPVERVCHRLEEMLGAARDGAMPPGSDLVQLLLVAADALEDARRRLLAQQELANGTLAVLLARLETGSHPQGGTRPAVALAPELPAPAPAPVGVRDGLVRLPAAKLDAIVSRSGALLVARRRAAARQEDLDRLRARLPSDEPAAARLQRLERELDRLAQALAADQHAIDSASAALEGEVQQLRMHPFGEACEGLERTVRDLARTSGKEVELVIEGAGVELDRAILDGLRDPLLHLVRNAVAHGIEPPAERIARGKPGRARITISAALCGTGVEVVVADDGRGLDLDAIRAQADARALAVPEDPRELVRLIFLPGFSTARAITDLAGRGVGLDVVEHDVETLHGSVELASEPGRGTRFTLLLPLTLTTLRALLLGAGGQIFALPTANVRRLVRAGSSELDSLEGRVVLRSGGAPVPLACLAETIGMPRDDLRARAQRTDAKLLLVIIASGEREVAFVVEDLIAEQDVVIKSLGPRLRRIRHFAGATVLPTGRLALILAAADLVQSALDRGSGQGLASACSASPGSCEP